jgi:type I restriction-modification system DNA methylase subunit
MNSREKYIQQIIESVSIEKRLSALSQLEKAASKNPLSEAEKKLLQNYEGMGGKIKEGAKSSARGGDNPLYEFYTPQYIASAMFDLARKYGYKDSHKVLEPSCATGRLIEPVKDPSKVTAFEITEATYRIAKLIYPNAKIYNQYFETAFMQQPKFRSKLTGKQVTWLKDYPFDMVIGNPPYGKYSGLFASYFLMPRLKQVEHFFMYYGLKLLRSGGLLIYVIPQSFMRNGSTYNDMKQLMSKQTDLVDAYRLPPVFRSSSVPVDIIVLRKK